MNHTKCNRNTNETQYRGRVNGSLGYEGIFTCVWKDKCSRRECVGNRFNFIIHLNCTIGQFLSHHLCTSIDCSIYLEMIFFDSLMSIFFKSLLKDRFKNASWYDLPYSSVLSWMVGVEAPSPLVDLAATRMWYTVLGVKSSSKYVLRGGEMVMRTFCRKWESL